MFKLSELATYQTGIYQARAYRNLRHFMEYQLKPYGLSSSEWSILGVVYDNTKENGCGVRVSALAEIIDVEVSFITNMIKKLKRLNLVTHNYDEDDGRSRFIVTTNAGVTMVEEIELSIRREMKKWLGDIDSKDLVVYIHILNKLADKSYRE